MLVPKRYSNSNDSIGKKSLTTVESWESCCTSIRDLGAHEILRGLHIIKKKLLHSKVVSTHLWNTPLNLYQKAKEGFLS